ncbi:MAG TPA: right-handed parallel beta-helix repeat-containing protein [Anaerolineales bacterium]|nr:right-handed parallel beta-helix repeat-containing protein [Anaerolineales bacterium]
MTNNRSIVTPLVAITMIIVVAASGFSVGGVEDQPIRVGDQLALYPNIETMGVAVNDASLPNTAQFLYRRQGETDWRTGHSLVRIDDGRLIGSLFGLVPETTYEVKVAAGTVEYSSVATTQPDELEFTPSVILHVNDDAPADGDGSAAAPFQTIQEAVNRAGPGTQVLVADGIYREAVTFPASGNADQWIQVKAEGDGAILDGSKELAGNVWRAHSKGRVWFTTASLFGYLARDEKRFYRYDSLNGLMQSRGHGDVTINEGWYFDAAISRLYIRSQDKPSDHTWRMSQLAHAFDVNGRDWIWIEGFEAQYYGRCGVCTLNASHLVIRSNKIHNMLLGIFVDWNGGEHQGNDTRIEYNEVYDPLVNEFPWQAVKGSSMEGTAIIVRGHIGAIVRRNNVHNFFNGIYTGSSGALQNPGVAFDADIYNNYIHAISDDALEPEGATVNHRFRNNVIDSSFVGVSLAPVTQGPAWVLRNVITNYTSRSIKWALNSDGFVFIYHNTSWTSASNVNAMDLITPVRNSVIRNNIFQSTGYAFAEKPTGSTGNDWNNNNWYTTRGAGLARFLWENKGYSTIARLCTATRLECNGYEDVPGFANLQGGNFTLSSSSPNIDRGVLIPGINDIFTGNAPDAGAYEFAFDPRPRVLSSVRADPNPTGAASVSFTVTFSESVSGVDLASPFSDFKLATSQGMIDASIAGVSSVSGTTYTVRVNNGFGSGTIRLDVIDDDSIVDSRGQPLGGIGTGNGDFTTGEEYTVNRSAEDTVSIAFKSVGGYDGWILESGENTNAGGSFDRNATTFSAGDDQRNRQYKSIVSFDTGSLPDNAVIVSAQLKIKRQGVAGTDPFGTHGALLAEIRNSPFSNHIALQTADFSAAASPGMVRDQFADLTYSWYAVQLSKANLLLINKGGVTQFRLFFSKDDNDDRGSDVMKFFSGNSVDANKPELSITYYVP